MATKDGTFRSGWCASGELAEEQHTAVNVLWKVWCDLLVGQTKTRYEVCWESFCNYYKVKSQPDVYPLALVSYLFCWRNIWWVLVHLWSSQQYCQPRQDTRKHFRLDCHQDRGVRQLVEEGWAWETYWRGERKGNVQAAESQGFACLAGASVAYPNTFRDHRRHRCELCHRLQETQIFHSSSTCQCLCDRGGFKCVTVAPNLFVSVAWQETGRWPQPWLVPRVHWPSTHGAGPTTPPHADLADGVNRLACPCAFPTAGRQDL